MDCNITTVLLDPEARIRHYEEMMRIEGLYGQREDPLGCYSALPLSDIPVSLKSMLFRDHQAIKAAVRGAGISIYDPGDAPFNPELGISDDPDRVYDLDTAKVAGARFFAFTNYGASTGAGIEQQKAHDLAKPSVIFVKGGEHTGLYVSRMGTGMTRSLVVEVEDPEDQADRITALFMMLRKLEPGVGTCEQHGNVMLGFSGDGAICTKGMFEEEFPDLQYNFDKYKS